VNSLILEIKNVKKTYLSGNERIEILKNISLDLNRGESIAVTGASGCGKSTLLNLAGALDNPDSGRIISCGYEITGLPESKLTSYRSESVGFVFQFHYLLKDFTALENVMLPILMKGVGRKEASEMALEQLEKVDMQDRLSHYPSQLSGGERQRAALARALVNNPDIILADEPTGNLDESNKSTVSDLLFSLISESGKSLLLVTHAEDLAERASRRYRLHEGELFLI